MPTEQIIASAILYYESSPLLEDDGLMFRRERDEENDFPGFDDCTYLFVVFFVFFLRNISHTCLLKLTRAKSIAHALAS